MLYRGLVIVVCGVDLNSVTLVLVEWSPCKSDFVLHGVISALEYAVQIFGCTVQHPFIEWRVRRDILEDSLAARSCVWLKRQ